MLDNAEHLSEGLAPLLAAWRDAAPQVSWLLTSQRPLRLAGEQVLPLAPLALPGPSADDAALRASPAVALFVQRVQALRPDWAPDAAALRDAAAIAQALDVRWRSSWPPRVCRCWAPPACASGCPNACSCSRAAAPTRRTATARCAPRWPGAWACCRRVQRRCWRGWR
ncbi:MAG: hypothetical protein KIS83_22350 [Rubrivivax sp.]|nr:hypothetical protein [Rubrivivax sp.]